MNTDAVSTVRHNMHEAYSQRHYWSSTMLSSYSGLLGDALADKIVEMHESCVDAGGGVDGDSSVRSDNRGVGSGSPATPKEYVSFLRSWFDMHESKKVMLYLTPRKKYPFR